MKAVKLQPVRKRHVVGYPFKVNVDDVFIDLDDATSVQVLLFYQALDPHSPTGYGPIRLSADLSGATTTAPSVSGTWITVRERIREITPTGPGLYNLVVNASVNVLPPGLPPRFETVRYQGVEVSVAPR